MTKRFQHAAAQNDPMRVPPTLTTSQVPAIQPLRDKLILLDEFDPGYSTEMALRVTDGGVRLLSYAAEMHLITALMQQVSDHTEATAREALAQLVVAHNLRIEAQRTDSATALTWLKDRLLGLSEQWNPTELAKELNARDEERRRAAAAKRQQMMG